MPDIYRSIQGEIRLLEQNNDFIFPVEIWAYNNALTLNGWRFENLEAHREAWAGVPILVAYVNGGRTVGSGHNMQTRRGKDGQEYQSFTGAEAERIVGATSDEISDIRVETEGENKWLVAKSTLFRWYARELTDKIVNDARQGRSMAVSIEALVTESHMEGDVEVEDAYIPLGITILGDGVAPAVPGAHIAMLSEMESEFKELKLRAASYLESAKKPQNTNNKGVKKQMYLNKQQLKELSKRFGSEYAVLCAKQCEDGETKVLLMRHSDHVFCTYTLGEKDSAVDAGRMTECAANIVVELAEDETLCADAAECMEAECAENAEKVCSLTADVTRLTGELEASANTVKAMQAQESKRRISAAKEAAKRALSDFNAARENQLDSVLLNSVNTDIDAGVYANSVNADGEWIGESAVTERVLALCAQEQMKLDRASAQRKRGTHILDKFNTGAADDGGVQGLLARKGIN